jgi:diguanylate cyclase (GGDEF)-like protein
MQHLPNSWLDRLAGRLHRRPLTLEHSLTAGLVGSVMLLALVVGLVVRLSGSVAAIALVVIGGVAVAILLVAWYARTLFEVRQQRILVERLQREAADLQALHRLTAGIQDSRSVEALSAAALTFARAVFPDSAGTVATRATGQGLEVLATWGAGLGGVDRTGSCYAMRDGQTFSSDDASHGYRCQHVERTYVGPYLCVPIKGHAGTTGVVHLRYPAVVDAMETDRRRRLGEDAASRIGIGLETLELHNLLRAQSTVDPLTGLTNRRALFDHASRMHARAIGDRSAYSVIVADVDRFKVLNDTLGHAAGDAILVTFARHLQRHIRSQDFACRYGGEEFVVVMPDASRETAAQRAESIRAALGSLRTSVPDSVWQLSASFGVATFPFDGNNFAEVLRRADEAMYDAKIAGRNRVTSWNQRSRGA